MIKLVREVSDIPVAVGFGISAPKQAAEIASVSDGVIVGSAIVKIVGEHGKDAASYVFDYVKSMKEAIGKA
ncbi:Tryptophan synthase alpha chain [bioreactor metagenome]|uniref:tryptophan synthase n=1 Tax=bioreactor metagenome TaxID=1076179 RepID=A0A645BNB2_9ZZZZ